MVTQDGVSIAVTCNLSVTARDESEMWSGRGRNRTEKGKRKWKRGTLGEACIHKAVGRSEYIGCLLLALIMVIECEGEGVREQHREGG